MISVTQMYLPLPLDGGALPQQIHFIRNEGEVSIVLASKSVRFFQNGRDAEAAAAAAAPHYVAQSKQNRARANEQCNVRIMPSSIRTWR